jgi:hypothetical protein
MPVLFSNNASATLAASINSSTTTISVPSGQGGLFPAVPAGSHFFATLTDPNNNLEIVKVTARVGDAMTIVRGQEGTTAREFASSDRIELRITAAALRAFSQPDAVETFSAQKTFTQPILGDLEGDVTGVVAAAEGSTATTQEIADSSEKLANTAFVQAIKQSLHPVGSIYINATDSTNPETLFGFGTWVQFGAGRVPVGFNSGDTLFNAAEKTGGSKDTIVVGHTHAASTASAGSHNHGWTGQNGTGYPDGSGDNIAAGNPRSFVRQTQILDAGSHTHTVTVESTGSSGANANLQPYITVYMWKRTA